MNALLASQAAAQFGSLFVWVLAGAWYVGPWLRRQPRADALIPLLWVHVFRYVALQTYSAQHAGFPISDQGLREIVVGDVAGAVLALAAIATLRLRQRIGLFIAGVMVAETAVDTVLNIRGGAQEHLMGAASGPTWFILAFYVPAVVVSAAMIGWQLFARRGEPLSDREGGARGPAAAGASPPVRA